LFIFFVRTKKLNSITLSPTKFANIRRTLVNDSVTSSARGGDSDDDDDNDAEARPLLAAKRRYDEIKPPPLAQSAVKPRKRIILVRTKSDGSKYRYRYLLFRLWDV
jgi:hypothetical protein